MSRTEELSMHLREDTVTNTTNRAAGDKREIEYGWNCPESFVLELLYPCMQVRCQAAKSATSYSCPAGCRALCCFEFLIALYVRSSVFTSFSNPYVLRITCTGHVCPSPGVKIMSCSVSDFATSREILPATIGRPRRARCFTSCGPLFTNFCLVPFHSFARRSSAFSH